jgi:hypothetical protein
MKKNLFFLLAIVFLASCGNSSTTTTESDSTTNTGAAAVENVDGNIPDSTNSVPLNGQPLPVDSITTDSVRGPDSLHRG